MVVAVMSSHDATLMYMCTTLGVLSVGVDTGMVPNGQ